MYLVALFTAAAAVHGISCSRCMQWLQLIALIFQAVDISCDCCIVLPDTISCCSWCWLHRNICMYASYWIICKTLNLPQELVLFNIRKYVVYRRRASNTASRTRSYELIYPYNRDLLSQVPSIMWSFRNLTCHINESIESLCMLIFCGYWLPFELSSLPTPSI